MNQQQINEAMDEACLQFEREMSEGHKSEQREDNFIKFVYKSIEQMLFDRVAKHQEFILEQCRTTSTK